MKRSLASVVAAFGFLMVGVSGGYATSLKPSATAYQHSTISGDKGRCLAIVVTGTFAVDELTADKNIEAGGLSFLNGDFVNITNASCIGLRYKGVMTDKDGYTERFAYLQCTMDATDGRIFEGIFHAWTYDVAYYGKRHGRPFEPPNSSNGFDTYKNGVDYDWAVSNIRQYP